MEIILRDRVRGSKEILELITRGKNRVCLKKHPKHESVLFRPLLRAESRARDLNFFTVVSPLTSALLMT